MLRLYTLEELSELRSKMQDVVLIGGVFDILHVGHVDHLLEAKSLGKTLIVHITSDQRVREKKGPTRPIISEADRAKIIAAIRYVDYVFIDNVPHYDASILTAIRPNVLLLNHEAANDTIRQYLSSIDPSIKVVISGAPKVSSTTEIIGKTKTSI